MVDLSCIKEGGENVFEAFFTVNNVNFLAICSKDFTKDEFDMSIYSTSQLTPLNKECIDNADKGYLFRWNHFYSKPTRELFEVFLKRFVLSSLIYKEYPVITLCGSTKFKEDFISAQKDLTLRGYIVLSIGVFGHSGDLEGVEPSIKEELDNMHVAKIAMSDGIFVINKGGYIGEGTKREIEYAKMLSKKVSYLEKVEEDD